MQVRLAERALRDIEDIRTFIAADSPAAAARMAGKLVSAIDRLSLNPRLGRIGVVPGTFELIVRPYVIVYEIIRVEIMVLRVWHGRQRRPGT